MYKNLYTVKNHLWFLWLENAPCSYILYFRAITSAACKQGGRYSHHQKTKAVPPDYRIGEHFLPRDKTKWLLMLILFYYYYYYNYFINNSLKNAKFTFRAFIIPFAFLSNQVNAYTLFNYYLFRLLHQRNRG